MNENAVTAQGGNTPQTAQKRRGMLQRKPKKHPDGEMSLVEHIQELRVRVFRALIFWLLGAIIGYIWYNTSVGPIPSLGHILTGPYCSIPEEYRFNPNGKECSLIATSPFEMFVLRLKIGALAGTILSSPLWLSQLWGFVTPGLKKNEKKWTLAFSSVAGILFILGALLAYFVLDKGLLFLITLGSEVQTAALTGKDYFNFVTILLLVFGVSFEIPLLLIMLSLAGIISYDQLKDKRRYIIVILYVFAAFATPGGDPISMLALGTCLNIMMEIALQCVRINDRRRRKKNPEWGRVAEDTDDSVSPIEQVTPVESASRIESTTAVSASRDLNRELGSELDENHPREEKNPRQSLDQGQSSANFYDDVL